MVSTLRLAADTVLAALLSPPCASCGRVIDHPLAGAVCEECWRTVDLAEARLVAGPTPITQSASIGEYDGPLRAIIHALKYEGRRSVARPLARRLAACGADVLNGAAAVVPVPLHPRRRRERGFNQAADLACGLSLPVLHLLRRVVPTQPQVELPAGERHDNVRHAFAIDHGRWMSRVVARPADPTPLDGRVFVLVDDVTTTGATLQACARVLRQGGAREVRALTAARVASGRG